MRNVFRTLDPGFLPANVLVDALKMGMLGIASQGRTTKKPMCRGALAPFNSFEALVGVFSHGTPVLWFLRDTRKTSTILVDSLKKDTRHQSRAIHCMLTNCLKMRGQSKIGVFSQALVFSASPFSHPKKGTNSKKTDCHQWVHSQVQG